MTAPGRIRNLIVAALLSVTSLAAYILWSETLKFEVLHQNGRDGTYGKVVLHEANAAQSGRYDTCDSCNRTLPANAALHNMKKAGKRRCTKKLPGAIVIGWRKCGTGALKFFLSRHPEIAFTLHSVHYFDQRAPDPDLESYRRQMTCSTPGQVTMERTPMYFATKKAPERIKAALPGVKLIVLLRDPVRRTVSDYLDVRAQAPFRREEAANRSEVKEETKYECLSTFEESVLHPNGTLKTNNLLLVGGHYAYFLSRWLEHFPLSRILIIDGTAFAKDPFPIVKQVEEFLEIRPFFTRSHFTFDQRKGFQCLVISNRKECMEARKGRPHPSINETVVRLLQDYFEPFNRKLNAMLNQTFPWSI